jgi:hypothetical protein
VALYSKTVSADLHLYSLLKLANEIQYDPLERIVFVHANLLKEMPWSEFNVDNEQGVFRVFKDYTLVNGNTWLRPAMQTSMYSG